jgi:beta-lactam-binding protein with PASTA domain
VAGIMGLCFALGYAIAVFLLFPAPEVQGAGIPVPSLVGLDLAHAQEAVRSAGLGGIETIELPHPSHREGVVTAQSPLDGQQLRAGAVIRVAVSSGPPRAYVPDLGGFSAERATDLLRRLGFEVIREDEVSSEPNGRVIRVDPPTGTERVLPARVTITVSTGPPATDTLGPARPDTLLRVDTGTVRPRRDTLTVPREPGGNARE